MKKEANHKVQKRRNDSKRYHSIDINNNDIQNKKTNLKKKSPLVNPPKKQL